MHVGPKFSDSQAAFVKEHRIGSKYLWHGTTCRPTAPATSADTGFCQLDPSDPSEFEKAPPGMLNALGPSDGPSCGFSMTWTKGREGPKACPGSINSGSAGCEHWSMRHRKLLENTAWISTHSPQAMRLQFVGAAGEGL